MAARYYIAPIIQHPTRINQNMSRCQLYLGAEVGQQNSSQDKSIKAWCITRVSAPAGDPVWAELDADAQLTRIPVALLDTRFADLTQGQRDAIAAEFAARDIPSDWVTANTTLRQVIGYAVRLLRLTKRDMLGGDYPNISLDLTWGNIPAATRNRVLTWATNHGISTAGLTNASTIRQILRRIIEQYPWPRQALGVVGDEDEL